MILRNQFEESDQDKKHQLQYLQLVAKNFHRGNVEGGCCFEQGLMIVMKSLEEK